MTQPKAFQDILALLAAQTDWEAKHRALIDIGRSMPPLSDEDRSEQNRVRGCASKVWLSVDRRGDAGLDLKGESDSMFMQGIIALLLAYYSNRPTREIVDLDAGAMLDEIGMREYLTPQRSNGVVAMVARIRQAAMEA